MSADLAGNIFFSVENRGGEEGEKKHLLPAVFELVGVEHSGLQLMIAVGMLAFASSLYDVGMLVNSLQSLTAFAPSVCLVARACACCWGLASGVDVDAHGE